MKVCKQQAGTRQACSVWGTNPQQLLLQPMLPKMPATDAAAPMKARLQPLMAQQRPAHGARAATRPRHAGCSPQRRNCIHQTSCCRRQPVLLAAPAGRMRLRGCPAALGCLLSWSHLQAGAARLGLEGRPLDHLRREGSGGQLVQCLSQAAATRTVMHATAANHSCKRPTNAAAVSLAFGRRAAHTAARVRSQKAARRTASRLSPLPARRRTFRGSLDRPHTSAWP